MKESGIDWIGQIPEEWGVSRLKYYFDIYAGGDIDERNTVEEYSESHPYPVLSNSLENEGVLGYTNKYRFKKNCVTVTGRGDVGKAVYRNIKFYPVVRLLVCVPKSQVDCRFVTYWINSAIVEKNQTAVSQLTIQMLGELIFINVPFLEQKNIADFLDKKTAQLDKVKCLLEEQIQKLKDYRASLIYETVTKGLDKTVPLKDSGIDWIGQVPKGWVVKRLKYLVNKIGSGKTPLGGSEIFEETGILFIRSQNIHNGLIQLEDKSTYINRNIHRQMIGTSVEKNDILLNITGASIGRVAKYDLDVEANVNQHVCIIRCDRFVLPDYLMYFIMSEFGQFMIKIHQISGNREGLSFDNIGNFKIIIPDLDYQYKISQYLNKKMLIINQMIKTKEQQIENINKQRQTLIYDYVTGKRRV